MPGDIEPSTSSPYICFDKFITDDSSATSTNKSAVVCSNYGDTYHDKSDIFTNVSMGSGCCVENEVEVPTDTKIGDLTWDGKIDGADSAKGQLKKFKIYSKADIKKYLALKYILPYKKIWDEKINVTKYFACPDIKKCNEFECDGIKETCGSGFSGDYNKKYGDWGECGKTSDGNKKFCKRDQYCKIEDGKGTCSDSEFSCPVVWNTRPGWRGFGLNFISWAEAQKRGWSYSDWKAAESENIKRCGGENFRNMEGFKDYEEDPNYIDKNNSVENNIEKAKDETCFTRSTGNSSANYNPKSDTSPWGVYGDPYTVTFREKINYDIDWEKKNNSHMNINREIWNLGIPDNTEPQRYLENRLHKIWNDDSKNKYKKCFAKFKALFIGLDEDLLKIEKLLAGITIKPSEKAYEVEEELRKFKKVKGGEDDLKKLQEFDRASYVFYEIFFYSMLVTVSGLFIKNQLND